MWRRAFVLACLMAAVGSEATAESFEVEVQERVVKPEPANNGAGPLWCYGAPLVVRAGDDVYVSIIETGEGVPPLCNTRWQLWKRLEKGWSVVAAEEAYRQREPCPIVLWKPGRLLLSSNPSLEPPGTRYGRCRPTVLEFRLDALGSPRVRLPRWAGSPTFTDHSYRGFTSDPERGEALLLNIDAATGEQHVSWLRPSGRWEPRGVIRFPIRACYPQVALRDGFAAVLAIGDIVEPVAKWRELKRRVLKREWDYVFRRLFFAWTPDVAREPFHGPIEIDSVEETCGHMVNLDLYVDGEEHAHLLYLKRKFQYPFIRDEFFPGQPMERSLEYAVVKDGEVVGRKTLVRHVEGQGGLRVDYARFHVTPDGALYVVLAGREARGSGPANFVARVTPAGLTPLRKLPLDQPFSRFFTNTVRGGSEPADVLDLFGATYHGNGWLWYARIRRGD